MAFSFFCYCRFVICTCLSQCGNKMLINDVFVKANIGQFDVHNKLTIKKMIFRTAAAVHKVF